ncbi:MAG TPA: type II toxin-antitoxin system RelE/ParE family toxin [Thermotogota bacterium]|nr:type II toxin-antitoxin system RelE/ParE family toxin [Thermotogota bacterium]
MWEVIFYEDENNKPVEDFLDSLNTKMKAKALWEIVLLKNLGNKIREPYSKHIEDGIFELRIKVSSDIARVFYFFFDHEKIILTNGFIKKSNKIPKKEIEKARKYKIAYERSKK